MERVTKTNDTIPVKPGGCVSSVTGVVDRTPFYAESGGQVGDHGTIHSKRGGVFRVNDTLRIGEVFFHLGQLEEAGLGANKPGLSRNDALLLEFDQPRRRTIQIHHTSTHLLNWALREVLGDHIQQRGSLVDDDKTRFDFSHPKALTAEQILEVQRLVHEQIEADHTVHIKVVPQADALKVNGLRAVFGEKYPAEVRVISIGAPVEKLLKKPDKDEWRQYSIEFCGGTHLPSTATAEDFVILNEEAVAKGVRRITAAAGKRAERARAHAATLARRLEAIAGQKPASLEQDLSAIQEALDIILLPMLDRQTLRETIGTLQKKLKDAKKKAGRAAESGVVDAARALADSAEGDLLIAAIDGAEGESLRKAMDVIRSKKPDIAMLLAATGDDKISFLASVPDALIARGLKAGDWVREVAKVTGGGGGGRPDMAQAGGKNPARLPEALEAARNFANDKLGVKA